MLILTLGGKTIKSLELEGKRFDRLVVLKRDYSKMNGRSNWLVQCDCGSDPFVTDGYSLTSGRCRSCGCLKKEMNQAKHDEAIQRKNEKKLKKSTFKNNKDDEIIGNIYGFLRVDSYAYSKKRKRYFNCTCLRCGSKITVRGSNLKSGHVISCGCIKSKGEEILSKILTDKHVNFKRQYTFEQCVYNKVLRFDFAIFQDDILKCLVEVDGQQHEIPIGFFGGEKGYEAQKERDQIKDKFCKDNKIPLIRVKTSDVQNAWSYIEKYC